MSAAYGPRVGRGRFLSPRGPGCRPVPTWVAGAALPGTFVHKDSSWARPWLETLQGAELPPYPRGFISRLLGVESTGLRQSAGGICDVPTAGRTARLLRPAPGSVPMRGPDGGSDRPALLQPMGSRRPVALASAAEVPGPGARHRRSRVQAGHGAADRARCPLGLVVNRPATERYGSRGREMSGPSPWSRGAGPGHRRAPSASRRGPLSVLEVGSGRPRG